MLNSSARTRCGINSVVECHLAKVKVASSNLVFRSNVHTQGERRSGRMLLLFFCRTAAARPPDQCCRFVEWL